MRNKMGDIADRYTITRLKNEHGLGCIGELNELTEEVKNVSKPLLNRLYQLNKAMWDVELQAERERDLKTLGKLFAIQRLNNKNRIDVKNEINKIAGHSEELKKYTA